MLVITRNVEQGFLIGEGVYVKILHVEKRGRNATARVKVGIMAPSGVPIVRGELVEDVAGMSVEEMASAVAQHRP